MASNRISVAHRVRAVTGRLSYVCGTIGVCALLLTLWGCGSGHSAPAIKVSLTSTSSTVDAGSAGVTFSAAVSNDSKNGGVTFSLSPSTGCGSIPASAKGTSVVYTPQPAASLNADCTATITATSITNPSQSSTLGVTVKAITVTFVNPPSSTTLTAGAAAITLTAALGHDTATDSVNWSISAGCGTLVPNGTSAVYTPPSASLAQACSATISIGSTVNPNLSSGQTSSIKFTINPVQSSPLTITTTSLPGGVVSSAYSAQLQASGGTPPYTWSVTADSSLPAWLTLSASGTLSGTPTAIGTSNFSVMVTDSNSPTAQSKTQALSVVVTTSASACGSGNESALSGQYAFSLDGYNSSGFLAAIGSFTADGSGHISAGVVDSNGALGVQSGSITANGSSYSVGADRRGCATIVTPFYTFITRFALDPVSGATIGGNLEEWEPGPTPYIASGQILKQTVPAALTNGTWVYQQIGVFGSSAGRTGVVGTITASNGAFTAGEYDSNDDGAHHTYSGLSGSYTSPDATTGRFTATSSLSGITAHRAEYMVSSSQFLELTTDAASSLTAILIGKGQLQSGSLTMTGKLIYFASGMEISGAGGFAQFGRVTVGNSSAFTANIYEDDAGVWTPSTPSCSYAIDSYGKVSTSGTSCTTYAGGSYPPVFYLTGPNTGVMLGTDPGVLVGQLEAQSATSMTAGSYYFGTLEVVNVGVETKIGVATLGTDGSVSGTSDNTSTSALQQSYQPITDTFTENSDGTFSTSGHPGVVSGAVISGSEIILVDDQGKAYPTILVIRTTPKG